MCLALLDLLAGQNILCQNSDLFVAESARSQDSARKLTMAGILAVKWPLSDLPRIETIRPVVESTVRPISGGTVRPAHVGAVRPVDEGIVNPAHEQPCTVWKQAGSAPQREDSAASLTLANACPDCKP